MAQTRCGNISGFAQWDWRRWRVSFQALPARDDDPWRSFILVSGPLLLSWSYCVE